MKKFLKKYGVCILFVLYTLISIWRLLDDDTLWGIGKILVGIIGAIATFPKKRVG